MATEWHYGSAVQVTTPQAASILWAELIRTGHAFDNSQRLVDLPITARTNDALTVQAPGAPALAPPGWYMLFLVDQNRVPSVSNMVHLA